MSVSSVAVRKAIMHNICSFTLQIKESYAPGLLVNMCYRFLFCLLIFYFSLLLLWSIVISFSVCLSVCLSVHPSVRPKFLSTCITRKLCGRTSPSFVCMLPKAIRSSPDGVTICYVLPFLWMTSCFHTMGPMVDGRARCCVLARQLPLAEPWVLWVGWPTSSQAVLLPRWPQSHDIARAMALQSTQGPSQCLYKQSAVMTIKAATTQCPCSGLCKVSHMDVKIALVQFIRM